MTAQIISQSTFPPMIKFVSTHVRKATLTPYARNKSSSLAAFSSLNNENTVSDVIDSLHGFNRPEMYTTKLVGTVKFYERHVFLCYKDHDSWPSNFETSQTATLPRLLAMSIKDRQKQMPKKTFFTVCEGHDGGESSDGDILIFPDMIRYKGLTDADIDTFVEEVLIKGAQCSMRMPQALSGVHIFVCGHRNRDKRCGICGPILVAKLREEVEAHGLQAHTSVRLCSHVGGHKYAGNLIIYTQNSNEILGHWYGYVSPGDVSAILDQHIRKGEIIDKLWRGQMGLTDVEQKKTQEERLKQNDAVSGKQVETKWDADKNI